VRPGSTFTLEFERDPGDPSDIPIDVKLDDSPAYIGDMEWADNSDGFSADRVNMVPGVASANLVIRVDPTIGFGFHQFAVKAESPGFPPLVIPELISVGLGF
jgi:hypothetical protein